MITGNITVNQPIFGVEMQMASMQYNVTPSSCSEGTTNVETSGVFVQPGTLINNSNQVQFLNETASGNPNSNNAVSNDIKYLSSSAMTGNIPVKIKLGLPMPLQGLNEGCCRIDYEVCIKISVFYEDGTCKTCFVVKCFQFSNQ
jgi:hypothetical protein